MTPMNVSLPEKLKEHVETLTTGTDGTPSEYVRELIRADPKRLAKEKLDALLLEGLDASGPIPVNAKFWDDLKREAFAKLEARNNLEK